MRLLISILMIGQLMACIRHPLSADHSERAPYAPRPSVEVSMFTAGGRVVSAYVRHSSGAVLFHLSAEGAELGYGVPAPGLKTVLALPSPEHITFRSTRYENFERSFDMFQDGRIVLVPLHEDDGKAVGAFVNLVSGKRYFFAPSVKSRKSLAKIREVAGMWPNVTVIVPEDRRAHERIAHFPEFRR